MGVLLVVSLATQGTPWLLLMVLLGSTIGIVMGISYPFALSIKIAYIAGVLAAAALFAVGIRYRAKVYGQVFAVAGIIGWSIIGVFGLGTGS